MTVKHTLGRYDECEAPKDTYGPDDFADIDSGVYSPDKLRKTLTDSAQLRRDSAVFLPRVERAERRALELATDNARLRALIKDAEWSNNRQGGEECPWCECERRETFGPPAVHLENCPAFTPEGVVR